MSANEVPKHDETRVTRWIPLFVPLMALVMTVLIYFIFSTVITPIGV